MKCKACRAPATDKDGIVLCRSCRSSLERAIKNWRRGIERDLATLEAFDAYCAERERVAA
jgi:uncharacterized Zn finger protein (UPF0148 family)